jgi:hypothetical protein
MKYNTTIFGPPKMVKLPANFRCPVCDRKGGYARLKIEEKKIAKDKQPTIPVWGPNNEIVKRESVKRTPHRHPYRHLTIFGVSDPDQRPVINPPKPKPAVSLTYRAITEVIKSMSLLHDMIQFVLQKYPSFEPIIIGLNYAASILNRNFKSVTDDRHRRSAAEWALISKESLENGPNAASRKYPGVTTDGKQEYLSPEYIKQRTPEAEAYWLTYQHYRLFFLAYCRIIIDTIMGDPELAAIYGEHRINYDSKVRAEEEENERRRQKQLEEQQQEEKNAKEFYKYKREVFSIRHYDPQLYKQQKPNGNKRKADGKIEHKIKETQLNPEVVEELRRNKDEIRYGNHERENSNQA